MAGFNPIAQAFTCVFHNAGMAQIEGVPTTGPVVVITIVPDPIIATVINSAQREDGAFEIQFGAVVQNDIENDLNPRFVQRFYRVAKLIKRTLRRAGIGRMQREHGHRVVAPVVRQAQPLKSRFAGKMRHRQQLQRGNAETLEIVDHHRMTQRFIGSANLFRQVRMQIRQPFDMRFVNHGIAPRRARRGIILPVIMIGHHHALQRDGGIIMMIRFI